MLIMNFQLKFRNVNKGIRYLENMVECTAKDYTLGNPGYEGKPDLSGLKNMQATLCISEIDSLKNEFFHSYYFVFQKPMGPDIPFTCGADNNS